MCSQIACGGGAGQAPIPTATPAAEAPTSAPLPTAPLADQSTPTSIVLKPTSEPATGDDLAGVFGALQIFRHPSGLFSIDVPGSWKYTDIPFADRVQNVWDSPDGNFSRARRGTERVNFSPLRYEHYAQIIIDVSDNQWYTLNVDQHHPL
jgi:hypothetical protein